jgi:hypothetical protein
MIKSKIAAVKYLQRFQRVSALIESSIDLLPNELDIDAKKKITDPGWTMLGSIVCDIYYPIVREFPELRPTALLGKEREKARYRLMRCRNINQQIEVLSSDILPDDADEFLARYESDHSDGLYWLELVRHDFAVQSAFPESA